MSNLILYTTEDGKSQIQLRAADETVWLTQLEMAELFNATRQNISLHLKNIFEDGELAPEATVKESLTVHADGKGYRTKLYKIDALKDHRKGLMQELFPSASPLESESWEEHEELKQRGG